MSAFARIVAVLLSILGAALPTLSFAQDYTDIAVSVLSDVGTADPGDTVTFTVDIINGGQFTAAVTLANQFFGSLTVDTITTTSGTCDASGTPCSLTLAGGASATVTIVTDVSNAAVAGEELGLRSTVSIPGGNPIDATEENDVAATFVYVKGAPIADLGLNVTAPTAIEAGQSGTFTATLVNAGPDDAQNVTAMLSVTAPGASTIGAIDGPSGWSCAGTTCTIATMPAGEIATFTVDVAVDPAAFTGDTITASGAVSSSADPNLENNDVTVTSYVVGPATTTTLSASDTDPFVGDSVQLTAAVTPASGTINSGTLTIYDNGSPIGSVPGSTGGLVITTSTLIAGTHTLTAAFTDPTWQFGDSFSSTVTVTVHKIPTTTTLDVTPASAFVGDPVTLTATVTATSGSLSGTVTFYDGATSLGSASVSGGTASISTSSLAAGTHALTATFTDTSGTFEDSSSGNESATINKIATATTLDVAPSSGTAGDSVTLTATVTATSGSPSGTVTFYDGATALGTSPVGGGVATLSTTTLPVGDRNLTAAYSGDATYEASASSPVDHPVAPIVTGTTLTSSANPSLVDDTVTFTATVAGATGTPTGTVTFRDGTTVLGTATLSGGVATFATDALARGTHSITAEYSGDATHDASTSAALIQTVSSVPSGTTLTSSANPSVIGTPVIFTATVSGNGGPPTGMVTFRDGATVLGAVPLGSGVATYSTSTLSLGTHTITAAYGGDAKFAASTSVALEQQVNIDAALVEETFDELTEDFMDVRAKLLAGHIDTPGLNGGQGGPTAGFGGTPQSPELNFAMNSRSLTGAGTAAETLALGEANTPFGFWIDGTLALHQRPGAGGQFALLGMGADYLASDTLLAGVALYVDYMTDAAATGDVVGRGALLGPYVSAELAEGLFFDASLLAGRSWNDAHATLFGADFTGSFETTRWMLSSSLSGKLDLADGLLLRPDLSIFAGSESSNAYTVTGAGASVTIGAVTVETLRISTGAKLSRAVALENGLTLTPFVGARLGSGSDTVFALSNVFGTLSGGFTLEGDAWKLNAEAQLNGDSTGLRSQSVKIGVGGRF